MSEPQRLPRLSVAEIATPRSVAVFGASESRDKFGGRILFFLIKHGFPGRIVPINPGRAEIRGLPAFSSLAEAGEAVDVAILAVPPDRLRASVVQCAEAGVGCCVIITTGFAEAHAEGAALQAEIVDLAGRAGMRLLGPNCMGMVNPRHHMALCSSVVLDVERLRTGRVGLVSQSGAFMVSIMDRAAAEGIGFSLCASVGNQADLEICDFVEHLIDDPGTDAIAVYVEGFRDPARFAAALGRARAAGKRIVVLKTGRTADGVRAAQSHTASLAGSFEAFAAVCAAHGAVVVDDPMTLVRVTEALARHPRLASDGIGVLSGSGGATGVLADRVGAADGLRLARISTETRARLGTMLLPPQADNPVDLGGRLPGQDDDPTAVAAALAADPDVGIVVLYLTSMPFFAERTRILAEAARASGKFVAALLLPGPAAREPRAVLAELGVPCLDSIDDFLALARGLVEARVNTPAADEPERPTDLPRASPGVPPGEAGLEALVTSYGVAFPVSRLCADLTEARRAAAEIGFPIVLKGDVEGVTHKTDFGLVRTGVTSLDMLESAWADIAAAAGSAGVGEGFRGCLAQQQIKPGVELLAAIRRDPQWGPMVVVGAGGILVELLRDVRSAPAPLTADTARRLLRSLKSAALLDGVRGMLPRDLEAAADVLVRLSWLAHDLGERLTDLEINPLIVGPIGSGAVAVDLRATMSDGATR